VAGPIRRNIRLYSLSKFPQPQAGVTGRWHDNRYTLVTELSESGAGDEVIMSIAGHVSRAMLSRYSHVRMERSVAPSTKSPHASAQPTRSASGTSSGSLLRRPFSRW
jgi:hypothetical protein